MKLVKYGCDWCSWLCDKMVGKMLEKLQVHSNISVVQKNYLVGNSAHPKESFRTIRGRSNLSIGPWSLAMASPIALTAFGNDSLSKRFAFFQIIGSLSNHDDDGN